MATNDVWRLTLTGTIGASTGMMAGHFRCKAATPEPTNAMLATLAADYINVFRPAQHSGWTWRSWKAVQVRASGVSYTTRPCLATGGRGEEGIFTTSNAGTGGGVDYLPPQCALVVTLKTNLIGRSRRGRLFYPGLPEDGQVNGAWTGTMLTAVATPWTAFFTEYGFSPAGTDPLFEYGIWSMAIATGCRQRTSPPFGMENYRPANPDDAFTGIISATARSIVHTQRRRVVGVGV